MAYIRAIWPDGYPDEKEKRTKAHWKFAKRFEVRYRDPSDKNKQLTVGGLRTIKEANAKKDEIAAAARDGSLITSEQKRKPFAPVAEAWLASLDGRRKERTIVGYERLLRQHVLPEFSHRKLLSIGYADVDAFVRGLEAMDYKAGTVRNAFYVLKQVFNFAMKERRISNNPCVGVELPSSQSPEVLFLTSAQVELLAAELERTHPTRAYGFVVRFAAYSGLRLGELLELRIKDLNFLGSSIHVRRSAARVRGEWVVTEPKTRAGRRVVTLPGFMWEALVQHIGDRDGQPAALVLNSSEGDYFRYSTFYAAYRKAAASALPTHLNGLRFHDMRHTFASLLVEQGAHPKEMAELLGHSSVQITLDRYSHVMPHAQAALAERMDTAYRDTGSISIVSAEVLKPR